VYDSNGEEEDEETEYGQELVSLSLGISCMNLTFFKKSSRKAKKARTETAAPLPKTKSSKKR